jgi:TonB family protein
MNFDKNRLLSLGAKLNLTNILHGRAALIALVLASAVISSGPTYSKSETPSLAVELCKAGIVTVSIGNFEDGITKLEAAVAMEPTYQAAVLGLSDAYNREGARLDTYPPAALQEFSKALFVDPKNEKALSNSSNMIRVLGQNPGHFEDRVALAKEAVAAKDYKSAVVEYEAALALSDDGKIREELAAALKEAGPRPAVEHQFDFKTYTSALQLKIKKRWKPPHLFIAERLTVQFHIDRSGEVSRLQLLQPSGVSELDRSILMAVLHAAPFGPIPPPTPDANIRFTFDYNLPNQNTGRLSSPSMEAQQAPSVQAEERLLRSDITLFEKEQENSEAIEKAQLNLAFFMAEHAKRGNGHFRSSPGIERVSTNLL